MIKVFDTFEPSVEKTAIALGYFDGMHLAHTRVINAMVRDSERLSLVPSVLTFTVDETLPNKGSIKQIYTDVIKCEIIARHGAERLYMPRFSEVRDIAAETFFYEILLGKLKVGAIVCGYDYTFGKGGTGDTDLLMDMCYESGVEFTLINPVQYGRRIIGATAIREMIAHGMMTEAAGMLGHNYFIKAVVEHGREVGRTMGFPTINQRFEPNQVIPRFGVYYTTVYVDDRIFKGLTNVGRNPTLTDGNTIWCETHIIGLNEDLYGQRVVVSFNRFLRDEQRFNDVDELRQAIEADVKKMFLE